MQVPTHTWYWTLSLNSHVLLLQKTKLTPSLRGKMQQLLRRGSDVVSEELEIQTWVAVRDNTGAPLIRRLVSFQAAIEALEWTSHYVRVDSRCKRV